MGRKLCLAIGVGDAPPLDYLRGAVNGARAMADWARAQSHETALLTDEDEPLCVHDVKAALDALFAGAEAERLILYFAGHGLSRGAGEDLWLLSEWRDTQEAISVAGLRKRLERFGLKQLIVISDACRSIATGVDDRNLLPHAVLGRGSFAEKLPQTDSYFAASDARAAYMIPGRTAAESRCIFSALLGEALAGSHGAAADGDAITNFSLANFLEQAVPAKAGDYGVVLTPVCQTGIRPPHNHLLSPVPPSPPALLPWPTVDSGRIAGMGADGSQRFAPPPGASWTTKGKGAGALQLQEATPIVRLPALVADDAAAAAAIESQDRTASGAARAAFATEQRPTHFETGAGLSLHGADLSAAHLGPAAIAAPDGATGWWRIEPSGQSAFGGPAWNSSIPLKAPLPLLAELADGRWAASMMMPHFVTSLTLDAQGVQAMILRSMHYPHAEATEAAMADLMVRGLQASEGIALATELRQSKHFDPMMGVLAGYLHDAMGDVDNVRRTAFYHSQSEQMVAFDLVLLGRLPVMRNADGLLETLIPAVTQAQAQPGRAIPAYLRAATPEARALVSGCCPLLRQGWALLDPEGAGHFYPPGLAPLARHLLPAPFTTMDAIGGRALCDLLFGKD